LRQKEAWPESETHWAMFHGDKMLAHGSGLPGQAALIQELEWSGMQPPANALRRFILANPSHLAAKEELVEELKRIAELKTREKLGTEAGVNAERMLSDEDDQDIWGEYARLYRQTFQYFIEQGRPQWMWANSPWGSGTFMHSQTMKLLARSFLPTLEAALKRQPTDGFLWGAWAALSGLNEYRSIKGFTETLALSPLELTLDIPPVQVRQLLSQQYMSNSNWQGVMELQEGRWESLLDLIQRSPSVLEQLNWTRESQLLLEAYLRLSKDYEANELIRIWSQSPIWEEVKKNAVDLAKKCGRDNLAEQWGKL
jgi:ribulose bisphosphate carboxylase small subunit